MVRSDNEPLSLSRCQCRGQFFSRPVYITYSVEFFCWLQVPAAPYLEKNRGWIWILHARALSISHAPPDGDDKLLPPPRLSTWTRCFKNAAGGALWNFYTRPFTRRSGKTSPEGRWSGSYSTDSFQST